MSDFLNTYHHLFNVFLLGSGYALSQWVVMRAGVFSVATAGMASIGAYAAAILTMRFGWHYLASLVAATVIGVLAQRLTRTLCPACRQRDEDTARETLDELAKPWRLSGGVRPYKPVGCLECRHTGYRGRVGLYELLPVSEAVRDSLHPQLDMARMRKTAAREGLRPLRLSGIMKVTEGVTTVDEVLRNTPQWDR